MTQTQQATTDEILTVTEVEANSQDEMEKILNDINELQESMMAAPQKQEPPSAPPMAPKPQLKLVPNQPEEPEMVTDNTQEVVQDTTETIEPEAQPEAQADPMSEFRDGASVDSLLEETLGELKADLNEGGMFEATADITEETGTAETSEMSQAEYSEKIEDESGGEVPLGATIAEPITEAATETEVSDADLQEVMGEAETVTEETVAAEAVAETYTEEAYYETAEAQSESVDAVAAAEDYVTETEGETMAENYEQEETQAQTEYTSEAQAPGTMTMVLNGNMTLKLQYDYDGQVVEIGFKDSALTVCLADGTEFKIPVKKQQQTAKPKLRRVA